MASPSHPPLMVASKDTLGLLAALLRMKASPRHSVCSPSPPPVLPANLADATHAVPNHLEAHQIYFGNLASFIACNTIEQTILQQISTAVNEDCLANLIHEDTGLLEGTVPEICHKLVDTYYTARSPHSPSPPQRPNSKTPCTTMQGQVRLVLQPQMSMPAWPKAANASETDGQR